MISHYLNLPWNKDQEPLDRVWQTYGIYHFRKLSWDTRNTLSPLSLHTLIYVSIKLNIGSNYNLNNLTIKEVIFSVYTSLYFRRFWGPGMLGVAISRVRNGERLQVINFDVSKCPKQPKEVEEFYRFTDTKSFSDDLTCCRMLPLPTTQDEGCHDVTAVEENVPADAAADEEEDDEVTPSLDELITASKYILLFSMTLDRTLAVNISHQLG